MSKATDHANSASHKMAMNYYYRDVNVSVVPESDQTSLDTAFAKGDEKIVEKTKSKFEVTYFIAKEELSFKKYEKIINLEEVHSVFMDEAYRNDKSCGEFIDYLGKVFGDNLCSDLAKARFYSVLTDGSTDISTKEQESVFRFVFLIQNPLKILIVLVSKWLFLLSTNLMQKTVEQGPMASY